nr:putative aspartic-type endopeptidase [Quercus suber]
MRHTALLAITASAVQFSNATPVEHQRVQRLTLDPVKRADLSFSFRRREKQANSTSLTTTSTVIPLISSGVSPMSSKALRNAFVNSNSTSLNAAEYGAGYTIDIDFGGERFAVIFDTGSSDLWLARQGLRCVDYYGQDLNISDCGFGDFYNGSIATLPYQNFNVTYGDTETVTGKIGFQQVCVGGISVDHQEVALADYAYWNGDGVSSGVMGFAYPTLTSAYEGTDPSKDRQNVTGLPYTNWIFNAIAQQLIDPVFSVAMSRGHDSGPSGLLALGGLPDVPYKDDWASAPLQILELTHLASEAKNFSYYTIIPDGFVLRSNANSTSGISAPPPVNANMPTDFPVIIDSGTTLIYLPVALAEAVNNAFNPPATYIEGEGIFEAQCDAIPPYLAVVIDGKTFEIDRRDLLLTNLGVDGITGGCLTGVQPVDELYILGDSFLKNVVAVFDVGSSEMRFAAREPY